MVQETGLFQWGTRDLEGIGNCVETAIWWQGMLRTSQKDDTFANFMGGHCKTGA